MFFKNLFIYLKEPEKDWEKSRRGTEEKEEEGTMCLSCTGSFLTPPSSWGWVRMKPGFRNSLVSQHGWHKLKYLNHYSLFSGTLAQIWVRSGGTGTQTNSPIWDAGASSGHLIHCATMSTPLVIFNGLDLLLISLLTILWEHMYTL